MPIADRHITLRFLAAPTDAGYSGNVSGGRVLEWIDKAGYACAVGWASTYSVTAYAGNVQFSRPVRVGDLVEAAATLVYTGRSSMHIMVTVRSGSVQDRILTVATECLMVFVAMGADGRPVPVAPWQPVTDGDRAHEASARGRVGLRADIEAAMAGQRYTDEGTAPAVVLRFLAAPTDVNWGGKVHGGIVMRWIDEAAHVLASRWFSSPANAAVYAGGVRFYRPLLIGDVVEVEARLLLTRAASDAHQRARSLQRRQHQPAGTDHAQPHRLRSCRGRHRRPHRPTVASGIGRGPGPGGARPPSHPPAVTSSAGGRVLSGSRLGDEEHPVDEPDAWGDLASWRREARHV